MKTHLSTNNKQLCSGFGLLEKMATQHAFVLSVYITPFARWLLYSIGSMKWRGVFVRCVVDDLCEHSAFREYFPKHKKTPHVLRSDTV